MPHFGFIFVYQTALDLHTFGVYFKIKKAAYLTIYAEELVQIPLKPQAAVQK